MILYRHMATVDEPQVRELTRRCHPTWPQRPKFWYHANPTIVAIQESSFPQVEPGTVIGYGCYTVDNHPAGASFIMYLRDSAVDPGYRGRGIGRQLLHKRMAVGRSVGVQMFVGCTWPENTPMRDILKRAGFHGCQTVPNGFPFNDPPADGIIYINAGEHVHD